MPPRYQVGNIERPGVKPVASPVDSFERTDAGAQVAQLAQALSSLAPELRQFTDVEVAGQKQAGTKHAEELIATGKQIKAGEIAPSESKYFRMAAKEQYGRLLAGQFGSRITTRLADPNDPISQSTDPADFDALVADEREKFLAEYGPDDSSFAAGFNAVSNQEVATRREAFARQAGQRLETQVIENTYQEHQLQIEGNWKGVESAEAIAKAIYERNTIQYALNPKSGAMLSNTMLRAVIDTAKKMENLDVLEILKYIPGGQKGSMLANTSLANKLIPEAIQDIRGARQLRRNLENGEEKDAQKETFEVTLGQLYDTLDAAQENGQLLSTVNVQQFANQVMPSESARIYRAFEAYKNQANQDDEAIATGLWKDAFQGDLTYDQVSNAFESGSLTVETSRKLRSEIRRNRARKGATKALTQDARFTNARTRLTRIFVNEWGANDPDAEVRAEYAVQDMENAWVEWRSSDEGAKAGEEAVKSWLHNSIRLFAAKRGTDALREALDSQVPPESGIVGPQLLPWEKGLVIKQPSWLGQLADALEKYRTVPNYRLPPSVEHTLLTFGIKNVADAEKFLKKQRSFIPFNQPLDTAP